MNCRECGKKISIFERVKVGDVYLCQSCNRTARSKYIKWKSGKLPRHTEYDLLTEEDVLKLAMNAVRTQAPELQGAEILEEKPVRGQEPNIICEKDGKLLFIKVCPVLIPEKKSMISYPERKEFLRLSSDNNARGYYVDVSIKPADSVRRINALYLKNDDYMFTVGPLKENLRGITEDWIRNTLERVARLDPDRKPEEPKKEEGEPKKAEPRPKVKYSREKIPDDSEIRFSVSDFSAPDASRLKRDFAAFSRTAAPKTFQERLLDMIKEKDMSNPEFYNAALIDRKLFSAIKRNPDYRPKKETAVACCFGLGLNLKEAEKLIEAAGYSLSLSILWDRIVYFCLAHRITDLDRVNALLYAEDQKCIGVLE